MFIRIFFFSFGVNEQFNTCVLRTICYKLNRNNSLIIMIMMMMIITRIIIILIIMIIIIIIIVIITILKNRILKTG